MHAPRRNPAHGWAHADAPDQWGDDGPRFPRGPSRGFRLWAPVLVSLVVHLPSVFVVLGPGRGGARISYDSPGELLLALLLALAGPLALIGARRFPGPVVAVVGVAASIDLLFAGVDGPPYIAFAFAIGSAIVRGARVWAWATIAATWVSTIVYSTVVELHWQPWRVMGIAFGILIVVGFAEVVRTRRERIAEMRSRAATRRQTEVQAERVRIARELHDVLAHSLSQINVQAGMGLHLIDRQPDKARDALAAIKDTSKTALDEVRSVLGILRDGSADAPLVPEPDLTRLDGLAASVRAQGVEVTVENGLSEVPKPVQLAFYRIVQESLTNIVRHAQATRATVTLASAEGAYTVTVRDNGTAAPSPSSDGRGLLGMRERAELLGGSLTAGPETGGGFAVRASIPASEVP